MVPRGFFSGDSDTQMFLSKKSQLIIPSMVIVTFSGVILLYMFTFYSAYPTVGSGHLAGWTWNASNAKNEAFHGRFIPLAFVVMAVVAWKKAKAVELRPSYWGLLILGLGLLFYVASVRTIQPRLALIGAPFVVIGFAHFVGGSKFAQHIIFPAFFLWFAVPIPGLAAALTGNLQTLIAKSCYAVGTFVGMDLVSTGSTISVNGKDLVIAEGCSGIRSLMALVMIASVFANYSQKTLWKKAVLFLSSFPLAILGNFGRIFTILVLAQFGFGDFGSKTYHDWAGLLLFFPIALSGLYLIDYLLNFKSRRRKRVVSEVVQKRALLGGGGDQ